MAATTYPMRRLQPELLDELPAADPRARHARGDLRRIHRAMGSLRLLDDLFGDALEDRRPRRILELGAGDGSLMLRLARRRGRDWPGVELTLLDRVDVVAAPTREAFAALSWSLRVQSRDVFAWLREPAPVRWDLACANLFLHHFDEASLRTLFAGIAARADAFCAIEPRRAALPLAASRLVFALGANAVTRQDAVLSVQAGFREAELGALWPREAGWRLREGAAGLFSHVFVAARERRA